MFGGRGLPATGVVLGLAGDMGAAVRSRIGTVIPKSAASAAVTVHKSPFSMSDTFKTSWRFWCGFHCNLSLLDFPVLVCKIELTFNKYPRDVQSSGDVTKAHCLGVASMFNILTPKKKCPKCSVEKEITEFSTRTMVKGGKKYVMAECKKCSAERVRARYRMEVNSLKLRERCFELLGHACVRCGFTDKRALQFDHIDGRGHEDRKKHGGQGLYRHILKINGNGFQVLCANCNWIKKVENKEVASYVLKYL